MDENERDYRALQGPRVSGRLEQEGEGGRFGPQAPA